MVNKFKVVRWVIPKQKLPPEPKYRSSATLTFEVPAGVFYP